MIEELTTWLASDNGYAVHLAIYFLLFLGSIGFPIPEDLPLVLAGVAASKNIVSLEAIFLSCYIAVILSDQVIFFIGYYFGQRILSAGTRSPFFPAITEERVNEVREGLRRRRLLYIFIGRHLFPVRSVTFLTAGALRIPFLEFLIADAVAALISVCLTVGLGYWLGGELTPEVIGHIMEQANVYLAVAVLLVVLGFMLRRVLKKRTRADAVNVQNNLQDEQGLSSSLTDKFCPRQSKL